MSVKSNTHTAKALCARSLYYLCICPCMVRLTKKTYPYPVSRLFGPCLSIYRTDFFDIPDMPCFFQPSNRPVPRTGRLRYMTSILECFLNNLPVGVAILKITYRIIVHFTGNLCQIQAFLRSYLSGHRQTKKSAAALEEGQRAEHDQKSNRTYHHVYSIDCFLSIENHTMFLVLFPERILIQDEDEATAKLVRANLVVAIAQLSPVQARRLYARYALKRGFWGLPQRKV